MPTMAFPSLVPSVSSTVPLQTTISTTWLIVGSVAVIVMGYVVWQLFFKKSSSE